MYTGGGHGELVVDNVDALAKTVSLGDLHPDLGLIALGHLDGDLGVGSCACDRFAGGVHQLDVGREVFIQLNEEALRGTLPGELDGVGFGLCAVLGGDDRLGPGSAWLEHSGHPHRLLDGDGGVVGGGDGQLGNACGRVAVGAHLTGEDVIAGGFLGESSLLNVNAIQLDGGGEVAVGAGRGEAVDGQILNADPLAAVLGLTLDTDDSGGDGVKLNGELLAVGGGDGGIGSSGYRSPVGGVVQGAVGPIADAAVALNIAAVGQAGVKGQIFHRAGIVFQHIGLGEGNGAAGAVLVHKHDLGLVDHMGDKGEDLIFCGGNTLGGGLKGHAKPCGTMRCAGFPVAPAVLQIGAARGVIALDGLIGVVVAGAPIGQSHGEKVFDGCQLKVITRVLIGLCRGILGEVFGGSGGGGHADGGHGLDAVNADNVALKLHQTRGVKAGSGEGSLGVVALDIPLSDGALPAGAVVKLDGNSVGQDGDHPGGGDHGDAVHRLRVGELQRDGGLEVGIGKQIGIHCAVEDALLDLGEGVPRVEVIGQLPSHRYLHGLPVSRIGEGHDRGGQAGGGVNARLDGNGNGPERGDLGVGLDDGEGGRCRALIFVGVPGAGVDIGRAGVNVVLVGQFVVLMQCQDLAPEGDGDRRALGAGTRANAHVLPLEDVRLHGENGFGEVDQVGARGHDYPDLSGRHELVGRIAASAPGLYTIEANVFCGNRPIKHGDFPCRVVCPIALGNRDKGVAVGTDLHTVLGDNTVGDGGTGLVAQRDQLSGLFQLQLNIALFGLVGQIIGVVVGVRTPVTVPIGGLVAIHRVGCGTLVACAVVIAGRGGSSLGAVVVVGIVCGGKLRRRVQLDGVDRALGVILRLGDNDDLAVGVLRQNGDRHVRRADRVNDRVDGGGFDVPGGQLVGGDGGTVDLYVVQLGGGADGEDGSAGNQLHLGERNLAGKGQGDIGGGVDAAQIIGGGVAGDRGPDGERAAVQGDGDAAVGGYGASVMEDNAVEVLSGVKFHICRAAARPGGGGVCVKGFEQVGV